MAAVLRSPGIPAGIEIASRDGNCAPRRPKVLPTFISRLIPASSTKQMGVKRSHRDSSSSDERSNVYSRETSVDIKIAHLDAESAVSDEHVVMKCSLPPHEPLTFASIEEHDVHYQQVHMNRCSECQKNFPDQHYLHLHIAEYHDPINAAKRDQGERTPLKCLAVLRIMDKHQFPREYDFIVVKDGIDRRSSMLIPPHRRRSSTMSSIGADNGATATDKGENMDIVRDEEEQDDGQSRRYPTRLRGRGGFGHAQAAGRGIGRDEPQMTKLIPSAQAVDPMDSLASSMSALKFVPHSVRVARGRARGKGV
ncbi:metal ion binding protein [Stemphylium lycopersici]|nr:metal ion binding protein [Stemphylium lycopersici]